MPANEDPDEVMRTTFSDVVPMKEKLKKTPRVVSASLEARAAREDMHAGPPPDGRKVKMTGRTKQLNTKVRPQTHDDLATLALEKKSTIAGIIEWLVDGVMIELRGTRK